MPISFLPSLRLWRLLRAGWRTRAMLALLHEPLDQDLSVMDRAVRARLELERLERVVDRIAGRLADRVPETEQGRILDQGDGLFPAPDEEDRLERFQRRLRVRERQERNQERCQERQSEQRRQKRRQKRCQDED